MLPAVTMGPWVPVGYKPDEIIIMRRNPYFIEVDDQGNQLPYLDEISFKLSTWEDRTIQTVAGTADYTNMEDPNLYLESLKKAAEPNFPNNLFWSVRSLSWRVDFNLSTVCGVETDADKAKRELFRKLDFRRAVTPGRRPRCHGAGPGARDRSSRPSPAACMSRPTSSSRRASSTIPMTWRRRRRS